MQKSGGSTLPGSALRLKVNTRIRIFCRALLVKHGRRSCHSFISSTENHLPSTETFSKCGKYRNRVKGELSHEQRNSQLKVGTPKKKGVTTNKEGIPDGPLGAIGDKLVQNTEKPVGCFGTNHATQSGD